MTPADSALLALAVLSDCPVTAILASAQVATSWGAAYAVDAEDAPMARLMAQDGLLEEVPGPCLAVRITQAGSKRLLA